MPRAMLVTFKFYEPMQRYDAFFAKLDELSEKDNIEIFDDCFLCRYTGPSASAYRDALVPLIGEHDRLFICSFDDNCAGRLFPRARSWLKDHIFWANGPKSTEHVEIPFPRWNR